MHKCFLNWTYFRCCCCCNPAQCSAKNDVATAMLWRPVADKPDIQTAIGQSNESIVLTVTTNKINCRQGVQQFRIFVYIYIVCTVFFRALVSNVQFHWQNIDVWFLLRSTVVQWKIQFNNNNTAELWWIYW